MKLLIDIVYAQLFVIILKQWLKVFEAEDVKQSNGLGLVTEPGIVYLGWLDRRVHKLHEPVKQIVVNLLGKGIAYVFAFF